MISRERVAKIWVFRGLSDLFFAFDNDDVAFENNAVFSQIMGLEKFLKAVLLHQEHAQYESLENKEALIKLNKMAMSWSHKFDDMLIMLSEKGLQDIEKIKCMTFDGYEGTQLICAVKYGYMETRYPVPEPVSDKFPIEETDFTHDPLSSSGITKFIYALCNVCFKELSTKIDFNDMLYQFKETFQHRESFSRFNNCFWEAHASKQN